MTNFQKQINSLQDSKINSDFRMYSKQLNEKYDRFERIVKISRDITIESKRIIFLLHTIDRESKTATVLEEAERRLEALVSNQWKSVAKELNGRDPYMYRRAFSPGIQEFIEAYTYFSYLKTKHISHWNYYQNKLHYDLSENITSEYDRNLAEEGCPSNVDVLKDRKKALMTLMPIDFFLGLADVTGELMRKCINCLGAGNPKESFETCNLVKSLYCGFLTINISNLSEMSQKMFTLKQNLMKMEMACYNICLRKSEFNKLTVADKGEASEIYEHKELVVYQ